MRELGSFAVFALVSLLFIPSILEQNDSLREAAFGLFAACSLLTGGFKLPPVALL
jgi:hypothetical protein